MVQELERRGHACTLLLYNRHGAELAYHTAVIRQHWPWLRAAIRYVPHEVEGYDATVASSWETAHVLATRGTAAQHRFYFVQDFEPYFYPRGSLYALAEDTYRFGFRHIAVGHMVQHLIASETGAASAVAPFGCDTGVYRLENTGRRTGVVFFSRLAWTGSHWPVGAGGISRQASRAIDYELWGPPGKLERPPHPCREALAVCSQ
jgi:hypothetical protein